MCRRLHVSHWYRLIDQYWLHDALLGIVHTQCSYCHPQPAIGLHKLQKGSHLRDSCVRFCACFHEQAPLGACKCSAFLPGHLSLRVTVHFVCNNHLYSALDVGMLFDFVHPCTLNGLKCLPARNIIGVDYSLQRLTQMLENMELLCSPPCCGKAPWYSLQRSSDVTSPVHAR
jgi:hypothetical protein